jgi:hypothetical protein
MARDAFCTSLPWSRHHIQHERDGATGHDGNFKMHGNRIDVQLNGICYLAMAMRFINNKSLILNNWSSFGDTLMTRKKGY